MKMYNLKTIKKLATCYKQMAKLEQKMIVIQKKIDSIKASV